MNNEQIELLWNKLKNADNKIGLTLTVFHGYQKATDTGTVIGLFDENGAEVETLTGIGFIVFDHTVFYALGGGQISDTGYLIKDNIKIPVYDLNKQIYKKIYVHLVNTNGVVIKLNDILTQQIDEERRFKLTKNHTSQHLLSYIIEQIINDGEMTDSVQIKPEYALLAMKKVDNWLDIILTARNKILTQLINHDIPKIEHQMPIAKATELKLANPNFEYDPIVRVVEFPNATIDLCGGTHVENLQDIDFFEIWDCWIDKKKVRMQFSTNKITTEEYFTTWIKYKTIELEHLIKKIQSYDEKYYYVLPSFPIPTSFLEKNNLNEQIIKIETELNETAKEKYKLLIQKIEETKFTEEITTINPNLVCKRIDINDDKLTLDLVRNKLNKYLQEDKNTLLIFINTTLKYGFISFSKTNQTQFNLNNFLQIEKNKFNVTGGGTPFFINIVFENEISPFITALLNELKKI